MRIITATWRVNQYEVSYKDRETDTRATVYRYCNDAEGAAAAAIDLSLNADKYIIFGDKKILNCIPADLRANSITNWR